MESSLLKRLTRRGFTLLELSISIAVIGIMLGGAAVVVGEKINNTQQSETIDRLDQIVSALELYKKRKGHLPCPASLTDLPGSTTFGREVNAGDCTYTVAPAGTSRIETVASSGVWMVRGAVPIFDLLMPQVNAEDKYGNRYTYSVMQSLTETNTYEAGVGAIIVKNAAGNDVIDDGAFVVISHGKEGEGAYRVVSGTVRAACGAATLDSENCDADVTFVDAPFNDGQVVASYFSDLIGWRSKRSL